MQVVVEAVSTVGVAGVGVDESHLPTTGSKTLLAVLNSLSS